MKLIIQSDDLGITEAVSCGIARAAREGAITCTGLFSNMPAAPFAVELMKPYPQICLGEDINLVAGRPCADPEKVPSLVQKNGLFLTSGMHWAIDQKDGDQDREGEGYQRNHPLEQPAAGQHRQTEGDEDGKKGQLAHQQRHTDGRGNVRQLGKGMNLAQPAAVIHIKTDTFHSLLEVFDLGVGVVEGRQFAGQALEDKVDNDEGDDLVGNIDDDLIQEGAQQGGKAGGLGGGEHHIAPDIAGGAAPEDDVERGGDQHGHKAGHAGGDERLGEGLHEAQARHDAGGQADAQAGQRIDQRDVVAGGQPVNQVVGRAADAADDGAAQAAADAGADGIQPEGQFEQAGEHLAQIVDADAGRDQNDRCRIKFGLEQIHGIFLLYILPVQAREDP